MSFSLPRSIASFPKSSGARHSAPASLRHDALPDTVSLQEKRSSIQLTLAVFTALAILLFPAVLGLS